MAKAETTPSAEEIRRLTEMDTQFVSLVPRGANRQSEFFVVKADGSPVPPVATEPEVPAAAAKAVPAAEATPEDKRAAQDERAAKYGIEARADGNLSYPAGDPTTESLYGDPVNLMYPFGADGNTADPARLRNALARFRQAADGYNATSRVKVYERIVRAALAAGITPSFDPNDPIDSALPADLKDRLGTPEEKVDAPATESPSAPASPDGNPAPEAASKLDLAPWLEAAGARAQALAMDVVVARALAPSPSAPEAPPASAPPPPDEPGLAASAVEVDALRSDLVTARERIAALEGEVRVARAATEKARAEGAAALAKAQAAVSAEKARVAKLRASVAQPSALPTGEVPASGGSGSTRTPWAGDLAAQVRAEERKLKS
jgi:hypothetical protein